MLEIYYLYIVSEGEQQAKWFHCYKVTERHSRYSLDAD